MKRRPKALIFDIFGTVVDWRRGVAGECAAMFERKGIAADPFEFADRWRGQYQPAMQRVRSGGRGYVSLDTLHLENLSVVLAETGISDHFSGEERKMLNRAWEKLPPWPDAVEGLTAIKKYAIIAPCSNGSIAMVTRMAKYGSLPWDAVLGADIAQNYKPKAIVYRRNAEVLGLKAGEVMMVAAHNDDLAAARKAGLTTAFVARPHEHGPGQSTDLEATGDWEIVAGDFVKLAEAISRLPGS
ncbi:haloacid dehalogenase type II [Salaquimonas pukyongi]|uniref:haloacid dehalogenase type II n=1 Tax=Salaquimonas pukyongi TaxID=2712698 RepID=UPI00096BB127|nr:haloacid dehalogenase type II [Salaquimonas pukyongi]